MNNFKLDTNGEKLLAKLEGLELKPYKDVIGIWTIGIGNITYPNGVRVTKYDPDITEEFAYEMFRIFSKSLVKKINNLVTSKINQNQFNALFSFSYNLGAQTLENSTLLKKVNANPEDKTIANEFAKYKLTGGKPVDGLIKRRKVESDLYFKK